MLSLGVVSLALTVTVVFGAGLPGQDAAACRPMTGLRRIRN